MKLLVVINIKPTLSFLVCSGSLLGSLCHHDVQVAQHRVGTLSKQTKHLQPEIVTSQPVASNWV